MNDQREPRKLDIAHADQLETYYQELSKIQDEIDYLHGLVLKNGGLTEAERDRLTALKAHKTDLYAAAQRGFGLENWSL